MSLTWSRISFIESWVQVRAAFSFNLTRPADIVAPLISLAPRNKGHGNKLESLRLLAQETGFSVYWAHAALPKAQLRPLCDAVTTRTLKSIKGAPDLQRLYGGAGGKVLEISELSDTVPKSAPPPYGELVPSPPGAHNNPGNMNATLLASAANNPWAQLRNAAAHLKEASR